MRTMLLFWSTSDDIRSEASTSPPRPVFARRRVLAAVAREEVTGLAGGQRRQLAHGIALERLDLDDVSAALREDLRAEGDGDELAELDDLDAGERSHVVHSNSSARRGRVAANLLCSKGPGHERDRGGGVRHRRRRAGLPTARDRTIRARARSRDERDQPRRGRRGGAGRRWAAGG